MNFTVHYADGSSATFSGGDRCEIDPGGVLRIMDQGKKVTTTVAPHAWVKVESPIVAKEESASLPANMPFRIR